MIDNEISKGNNIDHLFYWYEIVMHNFNVILLAIALVINNIEIDWKYFIFPIIFGIIYVYIAQNTILSIFLLTGVLGGFTTYSQFTFDLIELNAQSQLTTLLYFFGTIFLSIFAGLLGIYIGTKMGT